MSHVGARHADPIARRALVGAITSRAVGRCALGVLTAIASLVVVTGALAATDPLAPYARLANGPRGATLLELARTTMRQYWSPPDSGATGRGLEWPGPPVGLYVSLVRGTETRACVGSAAPLRGSMTEAIRTLAIEALRADRRHPPVRRDELDGLRVVISFVAEGEVVADPMRLDPGRDGLLVTSPRGAVAFLPGEARTVRWALGEARRIGVIRAGAGDASFKRLQVVTLVEPVHSRKHQETSDAVP